MATKTIIIQNEDKEVKVALIDSSQNVAIDLTDLVAVTATLAGTSAPVVFSMADSEISVLDAAKGKISIVMSDTKTALLKVGDPVLEIVLDFTAVPPTGTRRIAQIEGAITVKKKIF